MTTKYTRLWGIGAMSRTMPFKWQWAVQYNAGNHVCTVEASTRRAARSIRRTLLKTPSTQNPRIVRRLIQVGWSRYNDTFSYNAKGNGNGR